jgi:hypothetical protein
VAVPTVSFPSSPSPILKFPPTTLLVFVSDTTRITATSAMNSNGGPLPSLLFEGIFNEKDRRLVAYRVQVQNCNSPGAFIVIDDVGRKIAFYRNLQPEFEKFAWVDYSTDIIVSYPNAIPPSAPLVDCFPLVPGTR